MRIALLCVFIAMASGLNISFVKEVTLSLQPPDMAELAALSPEDHAQVEDFLTSSLRLLDPIMRFFESMVGSSPPEPPAIAAVQHSLV
jgi:hypothetical protein